MIRICHSAARADAAGKPLGKVFANAARRFNGRPYASDPKRRIRFSRATLKRLYRRWCAAGRNPAALALHYRVPVKIYPRHALDFARACINSPVSSFAGAYGRLPRPRATVYAYRLALGDKLLRRIVNLFYARRLVEIRRRKALAMVNSLAKGGAK